MKKTTWTLLVLLFGIPAYAQGFDQPRLERDIAAEMKSGDIPGAAIVVVQGGRVIYCKGFGVTSVEAGAPVTAQTLFRLGSTTKTIVSLGVMRLVEQGRVQLDVSISKYAKGLHPRIGALTLRQLLTHTAGLSDDDAMTGPQDDAALGERIRKMDDSAFFTQPGDFLSYANPGYAIVGYVIEQVVGIPFADAMADLLLKPLAMSESGFRLNMAATFALALGHTRGKQGPEVIRPFVDNASNYPPGSLFTSAEDGGKLLLALLESDDSHHLEHSAIARLSEDPFPVPGKDYGYAEGLIVRTEQKETVLLNAGSRLGYGSFLILLPRLRAGVLVMGSQTGAFQKAIAEQALSNILSLPSVEESKAAGVPVSVSEEEARQLSGVYENSPKLSVQLSVKNSKLVVSYQGHDLPVSKDGGGFYHAAGPLETFSIIHGADGRTIYLFAELRALRKIN